MPRGIPNAKKDEKGLRYTTFNVPLAANPKHVNSTYLKTDTQSLWSRNASKRLREGNTEEAVPIQEPQRRGSQVIVIHPGSRYIRIGKASDVNPTSVPCVVARKCKSAVPQATRVRNVACPRTQMSEEELEKGEQIDDRNEKDPFDSKLAAVTSSLKERMRFFKLRATPNAATIASTFNKQFQPEIISEYNDPFRVEWIDSSSTEDVLVGEKVLQIDDPETAGYVVRRPIYNRSFNTRDYPSMQAILSDLEVIIKETLQDRYEMTTKDYKNFSVILVIPDIYDKVYVHDFISLLVSMGFKRFCAQQESLAATYGAGISNACVVDIGATTTSIACVDEGLVLSDTRMRLGVGGDDITEFLYVLLKRINFPYREMNLARSYDWNVMEDLKLQLCTLSEGDVALNLYAFTVRQPNKATEKYGLRAYDEVILAPMCMFEPRIIQYDQKRLPSRNALTSIVTGDIVEHTTDQITNAMVMSTQHLMPSSSTSSAKPQASGTSTPRKGDAEPSRNATVSRSTSQTPTEAPADGGEEAGKPGGQVPQTSDSNAQATQAPAPVYPGGYTIDVPYEASKLPLDVAIFQSVRAAGGDDRIRKYLQAVLVIGGSAHIPGIGQALETRLQAIATPVVSGMEKVQAIPPPKEVNPELLIWKGAAVLGKMESVSELWVAPADWEILGVRGLKERCFFL